uniref:Uncharacterized protein n=1 Tax=Eutreptiella gymnastica TaxID=73025 RepID=A0A7S1NU67_9EUGL
MHHAGQRLHREMAVDSREGEAAQRDGSRQQGRRRARPGLGRTRLQNEGPCCKGRGFPQLRCGPFRSPSAVYTVGTTAHLTPIPRTDWASRANPLDGAHCTALWLLLEAEFGWQGQTPSSGLAPSTGGPANQTAPEATGASRATPQP